MTMTDSRNDVKTRVRQRRRRIAGARREITGGRTKRIIIITLICAAVMFGGYFGVRGDGFRDMALGSGAYAVEGTILKPVTVYGGDTLWGIAGEYTEPSKDVRKLVREICELNDVSPGKIYPGQVLLVPVPNVYNYS